MADRSCPACAAALAARARFCTACGTPVESSASSALRGGDRGDSSGEPGAGNTEVLDPTGAHDAPTRVAPGPWAGPPADEPTARRPGPPGQATPWSQSPRAWPSPAPAPAGGDRGGQPGGSTTGAASATKGNTAAGVVGGFGAIGVIISVFLPWLRTSREVTNGWTAAPEDARVLVAIGVAALALSVVHLAGARNLILKLVVIVAGVAGLVYAVFDILSVGDVSDSLNPAVGLGLYVLPVWALVLLIGGAIARTGR